MRGTLSFLCHYYLCVCFLWPLLFRFASCQNGESVFNCAHLNSEACNSFQNGSSGSTTSFSQKLSERFNWDSRRIFLRDPFIQFAKSAEPFWGAATNYCCSYANGAMSWNDRKCYNIPANNCRAFYTCCIIRYVSKNSANDRC